MSCAASRSTFRASGSRNVRSRSTTTGRGLGEWCEAAVDALALGRFHLVVHDFGGPVGFELCARMPQRIRSLTILNTIVDVEHFHRPRALELLARPRLSVPMLKLLPRSAFRMHRPGTPFTTSLGDAELEVDSTGGSTILVWPRNLDPAQRGMVFAYARRHGFAIMRGGAANELTTANLLIRLKGASSTYTGAYAPDANRSGVPCYFGTVQKPAHSGKPWSSVRGGKFVASPANIGTAAPQGVSGDTEALLDGSLLNRLRSHIRSTGGSYAAR